MNIISRIEWRLYKEAKRSRLRNKKPTIIASNCCGTMIYYDMRLPFLTPTINLSFDMNDFVKFVGELDWYLQQPVEEVGVSEEGYPIGRIGDVKIRFVHYKSFDEAVKKWNERKTRINRDSLFILGIDGDNCTYETMKRFEALPYPNKAILTHKPYPEFHSAHYIEGFETQGGIRVATDLKKQFFIRRYLDQFDYVSFLNGTMKG